MRFGRVFVHRALLAGLLALVPASAVRAQEVPRPRTAADLMRAVLEKVLLERSAEPSVRKTVVVDTAYLCRTLKCDPVLPLQVQRFLMDTMSVQLGSVDSVVHCDLSTYPRRCTLRGGTSALKLHAPEVRQDTALVGFTWMELFAGRLWSHGAEYRYICRNGKWQFDAATRMWSS